MNNQGKNLFERALETKLVFGTRKSPNAIVFEDAVIIKRNFAGRDIHGKRSDGRPFVKQGRTFTLVLTEDMFNALCAEKGECRYGIWNFDKEDPELKVYTVEVKLKMESNNPPSCTLYTTRNGKTDISVLNSANLGVLDEIYDVDIERVDIVVNPYDPEKTGHFTLWLRDLKLKQTAIEESNQFWDDLLKGDDELPFGDPNNEA